MYREELKYISNFKKDREIQESSVSIESINFRV